MKRLALTALAIVGLWAMFPISSEAQQLAVAPSTVHYLRFQTRTDLG
jgi:hypothetical protein